MDYSMINTSNNCWVPSDGYKYITNGEVFTTSIFLGSKDNIANWGDTNEEPREELYDKTADAEMRNAAQ